MATQSNYFVLIGTLLVSMCIDGANFDWANDLRSNLSNITRQINSELEEQMTQINEDVAHLIENIQRNGMQTIQDLPRDAQGNIISVNDNSIISMSSVDGTKIVTYINGVLRITTSGHAPNGELYVRYTVEERIGHMLYHNETTFNSKTNTSETIAWKLNLAVPGAKPEIITDTKKNEK